MDSRYDGLQKIIDEALSAMAAEAGPGFLPEKANLAEFCRRTGLTRSKARTLRKRGFQAGPHGNAGRKAEATVLTGYTGVVDGQLRKGGDELPDDLRPPEGAGICRRHHVGQGLHRRPPPARACAEEAGGFQGPARQEIPDRARRGMPDGLGVRQCGGGRRHRLEDRFALTGSF